MAMKRGRPATESWLEHSRRNVVVVLEDLNFIWDEDELKLIAKWYAGGYDLFEIGKFLKRDPDEVWAAWMHLAREDKLLKKVVNKRS